MKLQSFIISLALAAVCGSARAQEQNPSPWFIQGQMGASYTTGDTGLGKLIAPSGAISVGKYFSPAWGARLSVSGWRGKSAWLSPLPSIVRLAGRSLPRRPGCFRTPGRTARS